MDAPCSVSVFADTDCNFSKLHPQDTHLVKLFDCQRDITSHLKRLGLKCGQREDFTAEILSEGHIIGMRIGHFLFNGKLSVCPLHRDKLGIHWVPAKTCQHPDHTGNMKPFRPVTPEMSENILCDMGRLVPVGAGLCSVCYKGCNQKNATCMDEGKNNPAQLQVSQEQLIHENQLDIQESHNNTRKRKYVYASQNSDKESITDSQTSNWSQSSEYLQAQGSTDQLAEVNECLALISNNALSPMRSQLKTKWNSASDSTKRYYARKTEEAVSHICELIAPGQSEELKKAKLSPEITTAVPEEELILTVSKMYLQTENNVLRSQLLAVLSKKYTKSDIDRYIPNISSYRYYQSQKIDIETTGLVEIGKEKHPRQRMNSVKLMHALSFFMDPCFIQSVSYGTRDLKLDSGESLTIPDVVRTVCHSQLVNLYISYCENTDFVPLGKSSLYNILQTCAASRRTNLQGLDNIAADGSEAFTRLGEIIEDLQSQGYMSSEQHKFCKDNLSAAKQYLKIDYKLHCASQSRCADHCITWLLSDPKRPEFKSVCNHEHNVQCEQCKLILDVENVIVQCAQSCEDSEEKINYISKALDQVHNWKRHIVRTINQDQSRLDILKNLKPHQILIIMDFAMKFLPRKYREKQSDWFGQRGKNWHVTVCIMTDPDGKLCHRTFTHLFESVKQDWFTVASILENTLSTIKLQVPHITEAFVRSDNAGCYHCAPIWLSIHGISERTGIQILNYCYSEAQSGKSYCDAKIAHMRTKMKTYVASGHDILTAEDMKTAIDHGKGAAGCRVAVAHIDTTKQVVHSHKMKNVTTFNDIFFHQDGMTVKQAYGIGNGLMFTRQDMVALANRNEQDETGLLVLNDFSTPSVLQGVIKYKANPNEEQSVQFSCFENGCLTTFTSYRDLEDHIIIGHHDLEKMIESTFDKVRRHWAKCCNDIVINEKRNSAVTDVSDSSLNICLVQQGWGLKCVRCRPRFPNHVKEYLKTKYDEGEMSGRKATPKEIEAEMRKLKDEGGNKIFSFQDCLTMSQIASYFSRLGCRNEPIVAMQDEDLVAVMADLDQKDLLDSLM